MLFRRSLLALCAVAVPGIALAQSNDPSFRLHNRGRIPIREVYVSSSTVNNWGPDRLGANMLPPGQSLSIRLPRGSCMNDIRIVWQNGQANERRGVNTCQFTDLNVPN